MFMAGAMCIVLFSAHRSFPSEVQGLDYWALGALTLVLAAIVFSLRNAFPGWLVPICGNSLLFWAIGFSMIGTQKFYGRPPGWRLFHLVWLAGMACIGWWLLVKPDFLARVAAFSLALSIFYVVQLALIVRHGERHFSSYFFGLLMSIQVVVVLARGASALYFGAASIDLLRVGPFQTVYLAVSNFMSLLLTVGFMTVATRRLQTLLEQRSNLDPLTGVLNRRGFGAIYAQQAARMKRALQPMTLLSIDLDHFKSINDRFGHAMGDRVLMHAASRIGQALRETDHVARFGGEEFVVLLPDTAMDRAQRVALRIQASLREGRDGGLPEYTASIGVACQVSADDKLDDILSLADAALYRAKADGRDRIETAVQAVAPAMAWQGSLG